MDVEIEPQAPGIEGKTLFSPLLWKHCAPCDAKEKWTALITWGGGYWCLYLSQHNGVMVWHKSWCLMPAVSWKLREASYSLGTNSMVCSQNRLSISLQALITSWYLRTLSVQVLRSKETLYTLWFCMWYFNPDILNTQSHHQKYQLLLLSDHVSGIGPNIWIYNPPRMCR